VDTLAGKCGSAGGAYPFSLKNHCFTSSLARVQGHGQIK